MTNDPHLIDRLTEVAPVSSEAAQDLVPLAWVLDEVRKTVLAAAKSLERVAAGAASTAWNGAGEASLHLAQEQFHRVAGVLELVQQPVAARFTRALEDVAQRWADRAAGCTEAEAGVVRQAGFALIEFLEDQLGEHPRTSVGLFTPYRQVQELAGARRIHPADMWALPWNWRDPGPAGVTGPESHERVSRERCDRATLQLMRGGDPAAAKDLSEGSLGLAAAAADERARIFWTLAAAFYEALAHRAITADRYVKGAVSQILLQFPDPARAGSEPSERLARDLLFFCALASPSRTETMPALDAVRAAWALGREPLETYQQPTFGLYDPEALAQAQRRIAAVKNAWSALAGGDAAHLDGALDQLGAVIDSMRTLLPASEQFTAELDAVQQKIAASRQPPSPQLAMEMAAALLFLEASTAEFRPQDARFAERLKRLAERLASVRQGAPAPRFEPWMEQLYRQLNDRAAIGTVVDELRVGLAQTEQQLDRFFRDPRDAAALEPVPGWLSEMHGVLSVLGMDHAAQAVNRIRTRVGELRDAENRPRGAALAALFQNFGNNFGTLGFLIDTLNYQPVLARKLFAYDEEHAELTYLPGRVAAVPDSDSGRPMAVDAPVPTLPQAAEPPPMPAPGRAEDETRHFALELETEAFAPAWSDLLAAPSAGGAPAPAAGDTGSASDDDRDLLEIFLGEAQNVMVSGHQALDALAQDPADRESLTALRRGFHTLKGSAAMLGLAEFSAAARALENILNSWLAEEKSAGDRLRAGSAAALDALGRWTEDLRLERAGTWRAAPFQTLTEVLRRGGEPLDIGLEPAAVAPAPQAAEHSERPTPPVPVVAADGAAPELHAPALPDFSALPDLEPAPTTETNFAPAASTEAPTVSMVDTFATEPGSTAPAAPDLLPADVASTEVDLQSLDVSMDVPDLSPASVDAGEIAEHPEPPESGWPNVDAPAQVDAGADAQGADDLASVDMAGAAAADEAPLVRIGALEISETLYSSFLKEADAWSEQLEARLSGWMRNLAAEVPEDAAYCAHSLAGSSATVGLSELSALARAVEAALAHVSDQSRDLARGAEVLSAAAAEIRVVLHQFAAGILKRPDTTVLSSVQALLPRGAAEDWRVAAHPSPIDPFDWDDAGGEPDAPTAAPALEAKGPPASWLAGPKGAGDSLDHDLFPIFEEEAGELLPQLRAALQYWMARPAEADARAQVRRVLHTLKGSARLVGALTLGDMAHEAESAIEAMEGEHLEAADIQPLAERFDLIDETFQRLRDATAARTAAVRVPADPAVAAAGMQPATTADGWAAAAPVAGPTPLVLPSMVAAQPTVRVHPELLDRLLASSSEVTTSRARLNSGVAQMRDALNELASSVVRLRRHVRDVELQVEAELPADYDLLAGSKKDFDPLEFDRYTKAQELTRMMAESVDDVETVERGLRRLIESGEDELATQARQSRELQHDLVRTRMVAFDSVAGRLQRVVRQAADESGKQARLEIDGGAIELDRAVLDRMVPAFEHVLRNSVVHGIEKPEPRVAQGKDPEGLISIRVRQTGSEVAITFDDDGAGLALDRIRARALELGLIGPDDHVGDAELGRLIFRSGFSTAAQVTELAGRGVGMDVVQADVEALGGRIRVDSRPGRGASFHLTLPMTTALTRVVMMRAGDLVFGVPSGLVETVRRPTAAELDQAYARASFPVGAENLPFFWAGALLQRAAQGQADARSMSNAVVVFRAAARRIAVHVDEVLGNQEVMIKGLGPQLSSLPGLVATTVLTNGAVALIYNPVALVPMYGALHHAATDQEAAAAPPGPPLVLVVDDSITVRRVMQRLLRRQGYRVALAADGQQGLDQIAQERPALVLTDIEMPRMDGFELLHAIRSDGALADLPVVVITSRAAEKHRDHAHDLGASHYLGKPYSENELLGLVRTYAVPAPAAASPG